MNKTLLRLSFLLLLIGVSISTADAQTNVFFEDFEDSSVLYSSSVADDITDLANEDYFGRIDFSALPTDIMYGNLQGGGFYGAQDTDSANSGNIDLLTLDIMGVDISNFSNLNLSFFVAEDDAEDSNEDWDITTSFRVLTQIDGGGYNPIFAIEGASAGVGNQMARVDTNFDGIGDGAEITNVFTQFAFMIADGNTFDLRIEIEDLDTGDEDIALDSLQLSGILAVPEPTGLGLLSLMGVTVLLRRRK